jgi:hypothetical protein
MYLAGKQPDTAISLLTRRGALPELLHTANLEELAPKKQATDDRQHV